MGLQREEEDDEGRTCCFCGSASSAATGHRDVPISPAGDAWRLYMVRFLLPLALLQACVELVAATEHADNPACWFEVRVKRVYNLRTRDGDTQAQAKHHPPSLTDSKQRSSPTPASCILTCSPVTLFYVLETILLYARSLQTSLDFTCYFCPNKLACSGNR